MATSIVLGQARTTTIMRVLVYTLLSLCVHNTKLIFPVFCISCRGTINTGNLAKAFNIFTNFFVSYYGAKFSHKPVDLIQLR